MVRFPAASSARQKALKNLTELPQRSGPAFRSNFAVRMYSHMWDDDAPPVHRDSGADALGLPQ